MLPKRAERQTRVFAGVEHSAARLQPVLERQERPSRLPLSYAQQRLWFIDQLGGSSTEYNMVEGLRLQGELDIGALERAINTIVGRHESLRTHFEAEDGEPRQVIEPALRIEVAVEDLSGLEEARQGEAVQVAMRREVQEAFDLSRGPLLRVKVLKLGAEEHILLRAMHHIVSDGWSEGIFNRELMVLYGAYRGGEENPLPRLEVQYADYTLWQRKWLEEGELEAGLKYWKEQLAGIPERLELATDRPRPAVPTFAADVTEMVLSTALVSNLRKLGANEHATLYMTLLAGFAVVLSRYSGQDDIVVGSPIANRQDEQLEGLIGFFVNTLVMRVRVKPEMSFRELLREVRRIALEAYQHQDVPFEKLVETLSPQRSVNRSPVLQVIFALQNAPWKQQELDAISVRAEQLQELRVRFDLEVHVWEQHSQVGMHWLFNSGLFDPWRIEQMSRHFVKLIEAVAIMPDDPLEQSEMLSPAELSELIEGLQ